MQYLWLEEYCRLKKGAAQEYKLEWQALRYRVGEKMFALLGKDNTGRDIIGLKLMPAEGQFLRAVCGYHTRLLPQ